MSGVAQITVGRDEAGMRLDRWFKDHYPDLSFGHLQKLCRTGQVRVDGGRVKTSERLESGQVVRVPPLDKARAGEGEAYAPENSGTPAKASHELSAKPRRAGVGSASDAEFLRSITLYEDDDVLVLNKPAGLAVQGGTGTHRHVDKMLEALTDAKGNVPRLVHRLDRDTAGCLVIAKRRSIAAALAKTFRSRSARKVYWALVKGVPRVKQGRISTYLAKEKGSDGDERMKVAKHGDEGADHALTYYAVVETAGQKLAWLSLKPVTGRTHQLRAHAAHMGHPIIGDPKYFDIENWEFPGGIQNKLHLVARRIVLPHPNGGKIDVTAPLPPHMVQSWNLLGFDTQRYDPIVEAPED